MRRAVTLGWQNGFDAIVKTGLAAGDQLVLTSLGQINSGTPVAIAGQTLTNSRPNKSMMSERRQNLEKKAANQEVSVEELIARRKKNKEHPPKSNRSDKVNN